MSLMDQYTAECVRLLRTRKDDPVGGFKPAWEEGESFPAAWEYTRAPEAMMAEQAGVGRMYRIYVPTGIEMAYHDVFRRKSDGQTFRVINPGTDRATPARSRIGKRLIEVEQYKLPDGPEEG